MWPTSPPDKVADLQDEAGGTLAESLGEQHGFVHLDVTDDASWTAAVAETVERFGGLDVVVNNAGVEVTQLLVDTEPDDVRRMLEVDLLGTMLGIKHAFRAMRPGGPAGRGGAVINVASVAATIAFPSIGGYSATKSGVDRLTRVAAMESGKPATGCGSTASTPAPSRPRWGRSSPSRPPVSGCSRARRPRSARWSS